MKKRLTLGLGQKIRTINCRKVRVLKNTKDLSDDPVIKTPSPHCKEAQVPPGQGRSN